MPTQMSAATFAVTFGGLLRQLRRRAGMTQGELAALVGFSVSQISRLEKDERLPDLLLVSEKFAPALDLVSEPRLLQKLLELAAQARGEHPPAAVRVQRTVQVHTTVSEEWVDEDALLPVPLTPLLARSHELDHAITRLMQSPGRLVTLIGPPGVGKTRLALAVAEQLQTLLADGAFLVPLGGVSEGGELAAAIVAALHLREAGSRTPQQRLADYLRHKELLLVLDDFEHLLSAPALKPHMPSVGGSANPATVTLLRLLENCPRLHLLVTSREPLRVRAEQRIKVQPLPLAAAVELFLRRAEAVEPDFTPSAQDLAAITELCLCLDCLPLAIELVAARIDLLSVAAMLARLRDGRLDLLSSGPEGGPDDLPAHQRTLRRAIQRSYALLDAHEQRLFRACAVFAGSFDLEAVEACASGNIAAGDNIAAPDNNIADAVQSLIAKSLVKTVTGEDGERRLMLLETLRAYAEEQLVAGGEESHLRRRHAHYYAACAERACAGGAAMQPALLHSRHNLLPALQWLIAHEVEAALQLVAALRGFWYAQGLFEEGRRWAQSALLAAEPIAQDTPIAGKRAGALLTLGQMLLNLGETAAARPVLNEAVHLFRSQGDLAGCACALIELGWAVYLAHEEHASIAHFEACLALAQQIGDTALAAHAVTSLAHVLVYEGAYTAQLQAYIIQGIALYRELHDAHGLAEALLNLCVFSLHSGDAAAALATAYEAEQVAERAGLSSTRAWTYSTVAELLLLQNMDLEGAGRRLEAALRLFHEAGQRDGVLIVQHHLGDLARRQGRWADADALFEASHAAAAAGNDQRMLARCRIGLSQVALAQGKQQDARRYLEQASDLLRHLPPFLSPPAAAEFAATQEGAGGEEQAPCAPAASLRPGDG